MADLESRGMLRNLIGRVKQAAGALLGNRRLEGEGVVDRGAGAVEEKVGRAARKADNALDNLTKRRY